MKTLHLLRHAKSNRSDTRLKDHNSPLAKRGMSSAKLMAAHLASTGLRADYVYCSAATRTRQTYELVAPSLAGVVISFHEELYLADEGTLLAFTQNLPASVGSVLFIGHNPGFHNLALSLVRRRDASADLENLREKYPTGTLCSIELPIAAWSEVQLDVGHLLQFIRPRDLE